MCTSENKGPAFGVRMKPSLKRYVEQWPGKNFSDKLEAIISFYQEHEKEQRQSWPLLTVPFNKGGPNWKLSVGGH